MEYDDVEFRDIAGAAGYRIGSDGSLWSCRSFGKSRKLVATWRRLAIHRRNYGSRYCVVCIRLSPGKSPVSCHYVHRLVLEAFVGPCPEGMECRHLEGDTANNALSNLAWGTPQENAADK